MSKAATCPLQFDVTYPPGHYTCTRALFHNGPHYDGHQGFWWGYTDQARDDAVQRLRETHRAAEAKKSRRARRRNLWGQHRWLKTW